MDTKLNQNYTADEINAVLSTMRKCINDKHRTFLFGESREKNASFAQKYQLNVADCDKIPLRLDVLDFCGTVLSENDSHKGELLYIFAPCEKLHNVQDKIVEIVIYIKFCIEGSEKNKQTVVISFHELERPIEYAFRFDDSKKNGEVAKI